MLAQFARNPAGHWGHLQALLHAGELVALLCERLLGLRQLRLARALDSFMPPAFSRVVTDNRYEQLA